MYARLLFTFLLDILERLEEDPSEIIRGILIHQTRMMRNATLGPFEPQPFDPPRHIRLTAALLFSSLAITLAAALISILIKGWTQESRSSFKSIPDTMHRIVAREYRIQGIIRYNLLEIFMLLPLLIYASLFLFSCGLTVLLFTIHGPSAITTAVIMGAGALFYIVTLTLSIMDASALFQLHIPSRIYMTFSELIYSPAHQ